ncbi:pheophorbide a oxygenase [Calothrix brevissima NIES-22]|nr:pheophorbide a oxygenase [Calothrix brevissima NIES-22]
MSNTVLQSEEKSLNVTSATQALQELPAGGRDPERFDLQEVWYPVHYIEDLDKTQLTRFTLRNLQRLRLGLAVVTAVIWALLPLLVAVQSQVSVLAVAICSLAVLLGGGIWLALGKLERRFYQRKETPPRNLPEKGRKN